jgi:alpha-L-fucosidase
MNPHLATPTPAQVAWHEMELGMFIHWSPGTYENTASGHDSLKTPLSVINPELLDTEQWVDVAESMGAKYIVLVAKHVGGFCLWQTQTTDYGIRNTPWRGGKGDIVKDLSESCRRRGLRLGVYLSPRDDYFGANTGGICASPEKQAAYGRMYLQQLTELLTRYGEMCEVWFDGSNVVDVGPVLAQYAPAAMVFQSRYATIRWVGNEEGIATYPAWNTVAKADAASGIATNQHGTPAGDAWLPLECDARIRANWFWTQDNAKTLKSLDQLMTMYYRSVGNGAVLLLNHTPDTTGRIPAADAVRAAEFGREIERRFGTALAATAGSGDSLELPLGGPRLVDHVVLAEDIAQGERIRVYTVEGWDGTAWQILCRGTAVGYKRIEHFAPVAVSKLRLNCLKTAAPPQVRRFAAFHTGVAGSESIPATAPSSFKAGEWGEEIYYGIGWGKGVNLEYDITDAIDDAGQFELRFAPTGGVHGIEVGAVVVVVNGIEYPQWAARTGNPEIWNLSIPGVEKSIRLRVRVRGKGGSDSTGVVLLTRKT